MERRTFLIGSAVAGARLRGAHDRIRAAIIGAGNRGTYLIAQFKEVGAEVAAVCDVYEPHLRQGLEEASTGAKGYDNHKRLLEDKSIDVVVIATPDHTHAPIAIDAVNAGKDVYVEKPMSHTIEDGFRLVEAVRATKRVLQVGTQRRSFDLYQEAKRIMSSGALGEVRLVTSWWLNNWKGLRSGGVEGKLDWRQWLGPAPKRPLDAARFHGWEYFWDYSGGHLTAQGAHLIDAIHWMMNSTFPTAVTCAGGRPNLEGAEVPETASMTIEYPENYLAVFTIGYKAMRYNAFNDQMMQFHGSKARFDLGRESYALFPQSSAIDMKPSVEKRKPGSFESATRSHIRNFLDCVRSRHDPNATVEMGQYTTVVLAMAVESLRTGRRVKFNTAQKRMEV